jgi:hypothetical protein
MAKIAYNSSTGKILVKDNKLCTTCCISYVDPLYNCCCFLNPVTSAPTWQTGILYPYHYIVYYAGKFWYCIQTGGAIDKSPLDYAGTYWKQYDGCGEGTFGNTPSRCSVNFSYTYVSGEEYTNYPHPVTNVCGDYYRKCTLTLAGSGNLPYTGGGTIIDGCTWSALLSSTKTCVNEGVPSGICTCSNWLQYTNVTAGFKTGVSGATFQLYTSGTSCFTDIISIGGNCAGYGSFSGRLSSNEYTMPLSSKCGTGSVRSYDYCDVSVACSLFHNL